eukprot:1354057-Amorphochlora_amoeboformis.AAC.1
MIQYERKDTVIKRSRERETEEGRKRGDDRGQRGMEKERHDGETRKETQYYNENRKLKYDIVNKRTNPSQFDVRRQALLTKRQAEITKIPDFWVSFQIHTLK